MTTTPQYFDITIDGRKARMRRPSDGQALAIGMIGNFDLSEQDQVETLAELFASLLETAEDRVVFVKALARGNYSVEDFAATFRRLMSGAEPQDTAAGDGAAAAKRTVKRAVSARTVSGRKRTPAAK